MNEVCNLNLDGSTPSHTHTQRSATRSDHNPLLMTIDLSHRFNKTPIWRFDMVLLQHEVFVAQFRKRIKEFVANNICTVEDAIYMDGHQGLY